MSRLRSNGANKAKLAVLRRVNLCFRKFFRLNRIGIFDRVRLPEGQSFATKNVLFVVENIARRCLPTTWGISVRMRKTCAIDPPLHPWTRFPDGNRCDCDWKIPWQSTSDTFLGRKTDRRVEPSFSSSPANVNLRIWKNMNSSMTQTYISLVTFHVTNWNDAISVEIEHFFVRHARKAAKYRT